MGVLGHTDPRPDPAGPFRLASLPVRPHRRSGRLVAAGILLLLLAGTGVVLLWPGAGTTRESDVVLTGVAEQVVVAYLHGDRAALAATVASELPAQLIAGRHYVRSASAVALTTTADGWSVTVAVDRLVALPGGFGNPGVEHYRVGFLDRPTGPVVAGLPAMVPAPEPPTITAGVLPSPAADDVTQTVRSYLEWLLVGADGAFAGRPVDPAPFDEIELAGMQRTDVGDDLAITVAVHGTRSDGSVLPMEYRLLLSPQGRGWQVNRPGS